MSLSYHFLMLVSLGVVAVMGNNYKPPAYHQPKYEPEIPACSKNTTENWCLEDSEYPAYEVVYELDKHYEAVVALYKNVVAETANSVDTLTQLVDETYLCPSATSYVQPLRAVNTKGKWRVIINKVESYGIKYDQHARIEECEADAAGKACPSVPTCHATSPSASRRASTTVSSSTIPPITISHSPSRPSSCRPHYPASLAPSASKLITVHFFFFLPIFGQSQSKIVIIPRLPSVTKRSL